MKITKLEIKNFRKIKDISVSFEDQVAVIVGPNATGKTSILEAIRLCKSVLMPRTHDEVQQVLIALGASTPNILYGNFQYDYAALAGERNIPLFISMDLALEATDIEMLRNQQMQVAQNIVAANIGQPGPQARIALIQYMSSEAGRNHLNAIMHEVGRRIDEIQGSRKLHISLRITPDQIHGENQIDQALGTILETTVEPVRALFSYFPADRSLPSGEVNVQLHSGDMKAHMDSHFASAMSKYPRLKQVIVNRLITEGQQKLENEFKLIFDELLPGKCFQRLEQKPTGTISVRIKDKDGNEFDIDGMSSGEKGLVLTFLLLRAAVARGGIILLDEPELHLNPAVCKRILNFVKNHVCSAFEAQVILCTHSAEILTQAFEDEDVSLFELLSPTSLNPLYIEDREEMFEALKRLGVSAADGLVSKGFVFVEGEDDIRLLEKGFGDLLQGFNVSQKRGRIEVLKEVTKFKEFEQQGKLDKLHVFVFDNDGDPVEEYFGKWVRVVQLKRYCIENYLLDDRCLFNLVKVYGKVAPRNRSDLTAKLKELAMDQLKLNISSRIYGDLRDLSCGMRNSKLQGKDFDGIAMDLANQLKEVKSRLTQINIDEWASQFVSECQMEENKIIQSWESNAFVLASGKQIIDRLKKAYEVHLSPSKFKVEVMDQLARDEAPLWEELRDLLARGLASSHDTAC